MHTLSLIHPIVNQGLRDQIFEYADKRPIREFIELAMAFDWTVSPLAYLNEAPVDENN